MLWAAGCPRAPGEQVTAAWAGLPWLLGLGSQPPPPTPPPVLLLTPEWLLSGVRSELLPLLP